MPVTIITVVGRRKAYRCYGGGECMRQHTWAKLREYAGAALGVIGMLLLVGSMAAWVVGPKLLLEMYESTKPVIPFFLAGLGLLVLAAVLAPGMGKPPAASGTGPPAGAASEGGIRCGRCGSHNDGRAKFCNQCGAAV
jgi:hypothetical protein